MHQQPIRQIEAVANTRITPHTVRITFGGTGLADYASVEPDQQVKLYFPKPGRSHPVLPPRDLDFMAWPRRAAPSPKPNARGCASPPPLDTTTQPGRTNAVRLIWTSNAQVQAVAEDGRGVFKISL